MIAENSAREIQYLTSEPVQSRIRDDTKKRDFHVKFTLFCYRHTRFRGTLDKMLTGGVWHLT